MNVKIYLFVLLFFSLACNRPVREEQVVDAPITSVDSQSEKDEDEKPFKFLDSLEIPESATRGTYSCEALVNTIDNKAISFLNYKQAMFDSINTESALLEFYNQNELAIYNIGDEIDAKYYNNLNDEKKILIGECFENPKGFVTSELVAEGTMFSLIYNQASFLKKALKTSGDFDNRYFSLITELEISGEVSKSRASYERQKTCLSASLDTVFYFFKRIYLEQKENLLFSEK